MLCSRGTITDSLGTKPYSMAFRRFTSHPKRYGHRISTSITSTSLTAGQIVTGNS